MRPSRYIPPFGPASLQRGAAGRTLLLTLIWLVLTGLCVRAGLWQLERASEKEALIAGRAAALAQPPLVALPAATDALPVARRITLSGRYDSRRQFLLDNLSGPGGVGYQVLTPLQTAGGWVLVNRGWLRAAPDRSVLPDITVSETPRTITAQLRRLPSPGLRLAAPVQNGDGTWPRRLLFPQRDELAAALQAELPDYQLLLEADQPDGYHRDWSFAEMGPATHYGYAMQWFAFAALTTLFYSLLALRGRHDNARRNGDDDRT